MTDSRGRARRAYGHAAAAVGLALLVAGCTSPPPPPTGPVDERFPSAILASREDPAAPEALRRSAPEIRCDDVILDQGEVLPPDALSCLAGATGPAELAMASPTTEGDPIVTILIVEAPGGPVQIHTDLSHDRFGSAGWTSTTCADVALINASGGCG